MATHARRLGRAAGCRALALLLLTAGCGELHFIPSPYTPQEVELIYSEQEHLTVMRWRVSATAPVADTRFELLGPDGYQPIDFSQSLYPGDPHACADKNGTCAQYVVRGQYTLGERARPVQAVHEVFGVLPGSVATTRTVSETLSMKSFFRPHNDLVYLNITDAVAASGAYQFPRPYQRALWPTSGLCISDAAPDGTSFSTLDATGGFPPEAPLTDAGTYCVASRPVPTDGGDAALVQTRIATVPEVVAGTQIFDPPVERSPIIYQLVLDLEIPVPDRCADVIQKLEDLTHRYMVGGSTPVHKLPTINLAENMSSRCAQTNDRTVKAADMAQAVKQLVTTLDGFHQQYHLMYFNNLDAPLPTPFVTSMQALFNALSGSPPGYDLQTYSWIFNPAGGAFTQLSWSQFWMWQTVDEMFEQALADYGQKSLPYTTQTHDPGEPVRLLSAAETAAHEGQRIKICTSSPQVQPIGALPSLHAIFEPSWMISSADPPSYLVELANQIVVRSIDFIEASAIVNYQICTRYCVNHPYVTDGGRGEISWVDSTACTSRDY